MKRAAVNVRGRMHNVRGRMHQAESTLGGNRAEGMGLEPTTPFGARHFQCRR
jgi:hypothetical protein